MPLGGGEQQLAVGEPRLRVNPQPKAGEHADMFAINQHFVIGQPHRKQASIRTKLLHQHRGAAIDEAFGQPGVERIGEARFGGAGAGGHVFARNNPVRALGGIGPGPHRSDAPLQGVDVARRVVELGGPFG